jgi:excisionase family DNA binding protein
MSGGSMLAAVLDPDLAGHLAVALKRHREALARAGRARPPGLADLEALALEAARGGHQRPGAAPRRTPEDHGLHGKEWLSPQEVATVTGLSVTTVRRHIRTGELASSKPGRRRLIARADLDDLMNRRRSGSGGGRVPLASAHVRPAAEHLAGDSGGGSSRRAARSDPDHQEN